jgi:hypothetical protein
MVYVPAAWGHGFLTVIDDTEIFHPMSQFYNADSAQGRAVGRSGVPQWLGRRKWKRFSPGIGRTLISNCSGDRPEGSEADGPT